jgi:hypothetical protein
VGKRNGLKHRLPPIVEARHTSRLRLNDCRCIQILMLGRATSRNSKERSTGDR